MISIYGRDIIINHLLLTCIYYIYLHMYYIIRIYRRQEVGPLFVFWSFHHPTLIVTDANDIQVGLSHLFWRFVLYLSLAIYFCCFICRNFLQQEYHGLTSGCFKSLLERGVIDSSQFSVTNTQSLQKQALAV